MKMYVIKKEAITASFQYVYPSSSTEYIHAKSLASRRFGSYPSLGFRRGCYVQTCIPLMN